MKKSIKEFYYIRLQLLKRPAFLTRVIEGFEEYFEEKLQVSETGDLAKYGELYRLISITVLVKHILKLSTILLSINILTE